MATLILMLEFRRMAPLSHVAFTLGCLVRTLATSATRRSVCVTVLDPNVSRRSIKPRASTSHTRKKWGTRVQLWVVRSAINRATALSLEGAAAGVAAGGASAALRTSLLVVAPSGP